MRIVFLSPGRTGYLDAGMRAARERGDETMLVAPRSAENYAFDRPADEIYDRAIEWDVEPEPAALVAAVDDFRPDVVIMVSWTRPRAYREVMKSRRPHTLRVLLMDNVWLATPKQWLGRLTRRRYLQPIFDVVMVPSDRTEFFAKRLGFPPERVIRGCWSADTDLFGNPPRSGEELASHRAFLSVGRLVEHKGADVLADAYRRYRTLVADPWDLDVVGTGPLAGAFDGIPGVRMHGFQQPDAVAERMRAASCFVLPSRAEPYGVVVHEAASAALPMLCTDFAGAVPMFVQDGYNGWTVAAGEVVAWAEAMARMSGLPAERFEEMSAVSHALSTRISPSGWARHVHEEFARRITTGAVAARQPQGIR